MGLDGFIRLMIDRTDVKVGLQGFKDALTSSISSTPTRSDGLFAPISSTSMPSEAPTYRLRSPLQASAALLTGQESPARHPASLLIGQEPCAERPADEHTGHKTTNIRINVKKRNKSYTLDALFSLLFRYLYERAQKRTIKTLYNR